MAQPSTSSCRQHRPERHLGRLSAHRSSSQTEQLVQQDQDCRLNGDQTQLRVDSWMGSLLRPQQWRLSSSAGTAMLVSALAAAVYMAADPALADTFHTQTASGPVVPGLSRTLLTAYS